VLKRIIAVAVLGGLFALPACTSNQSAAQPSKAIGNTSVDELQFQVGTANYAGTTFLNMVSTFRQPNGLSALLVNTPSIALPFTNTAPAVLPGGVCPNTCTIVAGDDSGQPRISGTTIQNNGVIPPDPRTFPQTVGAFAYGIIAANVSTTGADTLTFYPSTSSANQFGVPPTEGQLAIRQPIYGAAVTPAITQRAFYVGEPFAPIFLDGSLGLSEGGGANGVPAFNGYPSGFTTVALTPTLGTYTMTTGLPNASSPIPTFTSTTTMTSLAVLPVMPTPVFTSDGLGGGSFALTVPAGIRETAIFIRDLAPSGATIFYYTVVSHATGAQTITIPDNIGPVANTTPAVAGGTGHPTFNAGDGLSFVAIGFDYPAMEAVPIGSGLPQAPIINNSGTACSGGGTATTCPGQADVTLSPAGAGAE
jgi:hypothetical protein